MYVKACVLSHLCAEWHHCQSPDFTQLIWFWCSSWCFTNKVQLFRCTSFAPAFFLCFTGMTRVRHFTQISCTQPCLFEKRVCYDSYSHPSFTWRAPAQDAHQGHSASRWVPPTRSRGVRKAVSIPTAYLHTRRHHDHEWVLNPTVRQRMVRYASL